MSLRVRAAHLSHHDPPHRCSEHRKGFRGLQNWRLAQVTRRCTPPPLLSFLPSFIPSCYGLGPDPLCKRLYCAICWQVPTEGNGEATSACQWNLAPVMDVITGDPSGHLKSLLVGAGRGT